MLNRVEPCKVRKAVERFEQRYQTFVINAGTPIVGGETQLDRLLVEDPDLFIERTYKFFLDRSADPHGFATYKKKLSEGTTRFDIMCDIRFSPEASSKQHPSTLDGVLQIGRICQKLRLPVFLRHILIWHKAKQIKSKVASPGRQKLLKTLLS